MGNCILIKMTIKAHSILYIFRILYVQKKKRNFKEQAFHNVFNYFQKCEYEVGNKFMNYHEYIDCLQGFTTRWKRAQVISRMWARASHYSLICQNLNLSQTTETHGWVEVNFPLYIWLIGSLFTYLYIIAGILSILFWILIK